MSSNTGIYVHDADFETEVFPNVYWVPLCSLGKSRYTNDEMHEKISNLAPEQKYKKIYNIYEAIQLFHVSHFKGVFDNQNHILMQNDNVFEFWQTHKNGRDAIISNEGCCATDTNWLSYLLNNKYDFIGSFCFCNQDANGHITSYIKQNDWYYFIDMMMCRIDSQSYGSVESGNKDDLLEKEWAGSLFKCKKPIDFVKFTIDRLTAKKRDVPFAFYLRDCQEASATGLKKTKGRTTFYVPQKDNPKMIYINKTPHLSVEFVDCPLDI